MSGNSSTRKCGTFGKIVLVFLVLLTIAAPAFGQVRSVRARVIGTVPDVVTTRKANFGPGDILGTPLISITVNNGAGTAYLLLKLKVDFGGTWDSDFVQASLVKKINPNTTFTFTNMDIVNSIGDVRKNDFSMSDTLLEHTGVTGFSDITNLKNIPEGTYTIALTATEITLSNPEDINSSYTVVKPWVTESSPGATVEFKVVTIGSIGNITFPSFGNLNLTFQVPEIPVYSDSTSKTKIVINGAGVANYTATKNHLKSTSSSNFKGYPSDTTNGYVTYDLSAVPFRAGETYSIVMTFIDWNGADITSKTSSISFPMPKLNLMTPNVTDPYLPVLSWSFTGVDYSDWVKEYRVYLNGRYVGKTSEQEYQLTDLLLPNTAYTWYVMPYNKDDTPFFASSAGLVKSFTTKAHTDLAVQIEGPGNNSILIKGESYAFSGTATFSDGAAESAAAWQIGTESKSGMDISYTPSRRYAANSLSTLLKVTDSLGLSKNSSTIYLTVLEPTIAIQGSTTRIVEKAVPVVFALDGQNTRDLNSYEWFVNGSSIGSGSQRTHAFAESGEYKVHVVGTTVADMNGTTKTIESAKITVTAGYISISRVTASPASMYTSDRVTISVVMEGSLDFLSSFTYRMDGIVLGQGKVPSMTVSSLPPGQHTLSVTALDVFGKSTTRETSVNVYAPLALSITQPANDAQVSPDTNVLASMSASSGQYSNISWSVDGTAVPNSNFTTGSLGRLAPGVHTISVSASDPLGKVVSASVKVEVQSDFQLTLVTPAAGTRLIVGTSITGMVALDRVAGSQINLTDAARNIAWLVNGSDTGKRGLTYLFTGSSVGEQTIQARYQKGDMVRTSAERTISVRDIATPSINKPLNGATITYALGSAIALSASGEPGATFSWEVDGAVVAVGSETTYSPNGLAGLKQLKLVTSAYGRTKEQQVTVNLVLNSPPVLTLAAPRIQFTGESLAWTASIFDAEDRNASPPIEIYFDGVKLVSGTPRVLGPNDIGRHTLSAKATDANGSTAAQQVEVGVESSQLAIEIQSPIAGKTYFKEYDIQLMASLGASGGNVSGTGTFNWTVQYLDDATVQPDLFTGTAVTLKPKALGELAISARYVDGNGRDRGTKRITIRVEREPLSLGIYWPHGSVVNAGDPLTPSLMGLPATGATGTITWSLNGRTVEALSSLRAPEASGQYTLAVQYAENGTTDRAEIIFAVNGRPTVSIANPVSGGRYIAGNPVVLSARVDDDQPYTGAISWKKQDGTPIGEGNPFVLRDASPGEWRITATAVDRYGSEAASTVPIVIYRPVSNISVTVNNGQATYLIQVGANPLNAIATLENGIDPQVSWTLRQGDRSVAKSGREASFSYSELSPFAEDVAVLTVNVFDAGLADAGAREVLRRDYPIEMAKNAVAELTGPVSGQLYWVGEPVQVSVALTGFSVPLFSMKIDEIASASEWTSLQGTGLYGTQIPAGMLPEEGVYELSITVSENGLTRVIPFTLNVYQKRSGIFVDNAPSQIDLEAGAGTVEAVVVGLTGVNAIRWRTDLSATPVGSGLILDLAAVGLAPGNRSIIVEALSGSRVVSAATFPLKVYGAMELAVTPESDPLIVQRGAEVDLEALARDRDGSVLSGEAITWTSHLDGLVGSGANLALGDLTELSAGEHIFTIKANGANGATISALKRIQVNVAADNAGDQTGGNGDDDQGGDQGGTGGPPPAFGPGNPIPPPGGRGGGTLPPSGDMPPDIRDVLIYYAERRQSIEDRMASGQQSPPEQARLMAELMQMTMAIQRTQRYWLEYTRGPQTPQELARIKREIMTLWARIKQIQSR